jgi:hypothetical protein
MFLRCRNERNLQVWMEQSDSEQKEEKKGEYIIIYSH